MRLSLTLAGLILMIPPLAGCGSTPEAEDATATDTFVFRLTGLKGEPGMIPRDAPKSIRQLISGVAGVKEVGVRKHPENRLDNHVEVQFDPAATSSVVIAAKAREDWDIIWYHCNRCGETSTMSRFCCGLGMEELP